MRSCWHITKGRLYIGNAKFVQWPNRSNLALYPQLQPFLHQPTSNWDQQCFKPETPPTYMGGQLSAAYSINRGFLVNHNSERSRVLKLVFRLNGFILRPPLKMISRFPISMKRPHEAMQLQLSWSKSPESELRITSIPRLFVISLICHPNEVSRDEKIWFSAIPCSSIKNWRFSGLPHVAKI